MGKITKKVLFGLIIIALALPMFVGCEPDTPAEPPATDYKAEFLNKLSIEVDGIVVADVELINQDFTVDFVAGKDANDIKAAATGVVTAIRGLLTAGTLKITELKDGGGNVKEYDITKSLLGFETDIESYFGVPANYEADGTSLIVNYNASVTYKGHTFTLTGTVTFTNVPDLGD